MRTFSLPQSVKQALNNNDLLGFSYISDAARAIISHPDWRERWDFRQAYDEDIQVIEEWRHNTLPNF
jgi:hypothetical protein